MTGFLLYSIIVMLLLEFVIDQIVNVELDLELLGVLLLGLRDGWVGVCDVLLILAHMLMCIF